MFEMEGYVWVVIDTDGVEVKYQMVNTEGGGLDGDDEGGVGSEEEVVQMIMETVDRGAGTGYN
jgi:hypothetical protein